MKTLPLTVLVYEGPSARSYLLAMKQQGLRPKKILLMVMSHHPSTGKPIGRFLPGGMRRTFASKMQEVSLNYWPREIAKKHPELANGIAHGLNEVMDGGSDLVPKLTGQFAWDDFADEVDTVLVKDLKDPVLVEKLRKTVKGAVLYTGGGLVPRSLLELDGIRFLHVHPGYLPDVRGADCLLWSVLLRGRPGASCFYMAPGIDVGHIIAARDFPALSIALGAARPDNDTLYRAIFSFYDPMLRAALFVQDVLPLGDDLMDLPSTPQDESVGVTYHFLHPRMKNAGLARVFPG